MMPLLCLFCHPATPDLRAGRFPADTPLDTRGHAAAAQAAASLTQRYPDAALFCSPALCARQTAEAFGPQATPTAALADVDYGAWRGKSLADIVRDQPQAAQAWLRDPAMRSHGGEAFADVITRVGAWLDALDLQGNGIAITHPAVIRAALVHVMGAPAEAWFRLEPAPLSQIELRRSARGWLWSLSSPATAQTSLRTTRS